MKNLIFKIMTESIQSLTEDKISDVWNKLKKRLEAEHVTKEEFDKLVELSWEFDKGANANKGVSVLLYPFLNWYMGIRSAGGRGSFIEDMREDTLREMLIMTVKRREWRAALNLPSIRSVDDFKNKVYDLGLMKRPGENVAVEQEEDPEVYAKVMSETDILYQDDSWIVVHPHNTYSGRWWSGQDYLTKEQLKDEGRESLRDMNIPFNYNSGAKWCTARGISGHKDSDIQRVFDDYNGGNEPGNGYLRILRPLFKGSFVKRVIPGETSGDINRWRAFQLSDPTSNGKPHQFMDGSNHNVTYADFFANRATPGLRKWYYKTYLQGLIKSHGFVVDDNGNSNMLVTHDSMFDGFEKGYSVNATEKNVTSTDAKKIFDNRDNTKDVGVFDELGYDIDDFGDIRDKINVQFSDDFIKNYWASHKELGAMPKSSSEASKRIISSLPYDKIERAFANNTTFNYAEAYKILVDVIQNSAFAHHYRLKLKNPKRSLASTMTLDAFTIKSILDSLGGKISAKGEVNLGDIKELFDSQGRYGDNETTTIKVINSPFFSIPMVSLMTFNDWGFQSDVENLALSGELKSDKYSYSKDPRQASLFPESKVDKAVNYILGI